MPEKNTRKRLYKAISCILSIAFWIGLWALLAYKVDLELLLPSPARTVSALVELAGDKAFWLITLSSLLRVLEGILIAVLLGTMLGIFSAKLNIVDSLFSPLMTLIKATPVASFIILAILWIERNSLPAFITALIVLPIVWANVSAGIRAVSGELLDVAKIYKFPFRKQIMKIYVPTVMPYFLAACRASLGMAWKAGIAAEVLCVPKNAIGTQIYLAKTSGETAVLFAWTVSVVILSVIIEKLLIFGLRKLSEGLHLSAKEV